jgi:hypothetical protein
MKINFYIFFALLSLYFSQNIVTSWNYDKVAMYDLQKIITFLNNFASKTIDLPVIKKDTIEIKNLKLIKVSTNLYDSLINYNTGLLLLAPNKVTLNFNFSYTESSKGLTGNAELALNILSFKLKVSNNKTAGNAEFEIRMTSPKENFSVPGIKDKEFLKKLIEALYEGFNKESILNKKIGDLMQKEISKYYIDFYKKYQNFMLQTGTFFENTNVPIKKDKFMYFCEDSSGEYKTASCYYSGEVQKTSFINYENTDKTLIPKFSNANEDLYKIFVNNDLVKNSIDFIADKYFKTKAKIYNEKTNVKQLSYDFTVASLQKYFKGLEKLKPTDKWDCEVYIQSGDVNQAVYLVKFNIKNTKDNFEIKITSDLTLDVSILKTVRFNICLKGTKTSKVEAITPTIQIADEPGLKKAIEESFDFKHNPICLSNTGISLKNYYTEISKAYAKKEGIYFEGEQLYQ